MDYFRVPVGRGPRVLSARLEGIAAVDLVLEMFDARGDLLGKSDAHGVGGGEWLQPVMIGPSEAYLLVRQVWVQGTEPIENVADPYRLSVHWGPAAPGWEIEPNGWRKRATPAEAGRYIKGYLGSADDKDWFVFTPAATGYLVGRVVAPDGVVAPGVLLQPKIEAEVAFLLSGDLDGALEGVDDRDSGLASGLVNTTQQIGGALGVLVWASAWASGLPWAAALLPAAGAGARTGRPLTT